jgi:PAS domain S-box-containing protein
MRQRWIVPATAGLALLGIFAARQAFPQAVGRSPRQYIVDMWRRSAGLPQNYVFTILQTRDGYLWIGTRSGLARFDGMRFTTYDDRKPGELKESEVWALAEDRDAGLWVGTYGGGVSRLKDGKFTTFTKADGLPSNLVQSLAVTPDGTVWIGTAGGLAQSRGGRIAPVEEAPLPGPSVVSMLVDPLGTLWIGTNRGLGSLKDGRYVNHTAAHPDALLGTVTAIAGGGTAPLWMAISETGGPDDGLRVLDGDGITTYTIRDGLPSNVVMSLAIGDDGTVWAGTRQGLSRLRRDLPPLSGARPPGRPAGIPQVGRFETYISDVWGTAGVRMLDRVTQQGVPALTFDRERSLWFGTQLDGLGRLRSAPLLNVTGGPLSEWDVDVRTFLEDARGGMWLGTNRELRKLEPGGAKLIPLPLGVEADALVDGGDGTILIGSTSGLFIWRGGRVETWGILDKAPPISVMLKDSRGQVWIGTRADGVFRYSHGSVVHYTPTDGLLGTQVRAIAEGPDGAIWFGTRAGGATCLKNGRFTTFSMKEGLPGPDVQALIVDHAGTVWVATRQGLCRLKDGRAATITAQQGLPANYFYQIMEDGEYLWLTSAQGIARVETASLHAVADGQADSVRVRAFGEESGLGNATLTLVHQRTAWKARDGRLWFATTRGAAVIDPRVSERNTIPPPVHIEEVLANRQSVAAVDGMTLRSGQREIEIHYAGLSFVDPARVSFRYKLEGFDADWIDVATRRVAYYTNLPAGSYRFRVIACNNDGVWNETGASLAFGVLPRWYERADLRLLGVVLVAVGALGTHRLRLAQLRRRERVLSRRVEERTRDLQRLTELLEVRVRERTAELAETNADLSSEKERLAVTLRSIGDGVIATDVAGTVVLMNRVAEELTGWRAAEAAGRPFAEVFRTVDRPRRQALPDPSRRALEEGVTVTVGDPCVLVARDGRERLVADSAAPIRDPVSRIVGAVLVFRDVTERERIEDQLRNAQKLEALGVLAGGIAHDFNNLLTGVFGFIDLARAAAGDAASVRESTSEAMGVLEKARGLTRQLLTFSKAGEPVRRTVSLGPLVEGSARFVFSGTNLAVDFDVAPDLWPCEVDEQQIGQVVDNLLINARQAMPSGGTVRIEMANVAAATGAAQAPCVRLSVQDEGPGIPRELWTRIFDPFFTTKAAGSGLGLAMVYSIVRRHGGRVEVGVARRGSGARFDVLLPAVPGAVPQDRSASAPGAAVAMGRGNGRIMVMDDEEHIRNLARAALGRLGYVVVLARDDQEAVAIARETLDRGERLDAVILDLTISGGTGGVEALNLLRAILPDLPAIASSGYSADAIMARPMDFGFDAALPKPYALAEIGSVVSSVLARHKA